MSVILDVMMELRSKYRASMSRLLILSVLLTELLIFPAYAQAPSDLNLKSFMDLPGQVSALVIQDNVPMAELNADRSLAVASAFKLSVLAALQQQIQAGSHAWDELVCLSPKAKSLPSGILQAWPDKTPMTVQTLATLMISLSDNTAADMLMQLLEPNHLRSTPSNPLLTTRQAFILKNPDNQSLLTTYRQSENRQAVLAQIDQAPLPNVELVDTVPLAQDIEWFFSNQELCAYMAEVANLPLMQINTGLIDPAPWQQVAFKGGAEPGVLNLTSALTSKDGHHYCVSATWNDGQPLDEYRFFAAYSDLIAGLSTAG